MNILYNLGVAPQEKCGVRLSAAIFFYRRKGGKKRISTAILNAALQHTIALFLESFD